jgi:hypothetical protein
MHIFTATLKHSANINQRQGTNLNPHRYAMACRRKKAAYAEHLSYNPF